MKFDVELYATWRRNHPTRPLPREVEEHMVLEIVRLQEEVQAERAAVVAWLLAKANAEHPIERGVPSLSPAGRGLLLLHADSIERGEHRREEER